MSTKHTPGPWKVGELSEEVIDSRGYPIACPPQDEQPQDNPSTDDLAIAVGILNRVTRKLEWHGNARLIAAAPELLAACKALLYDVHFDAEFKTWVIGPKSDVAGGTLEYLRAAIAKAEGK